MKPRNRAKIVEWVGGVFAPGSAGDAGASLDGNEALFWAASDGRVVGLTVGQRAELLRTACDSLRAAMAKPMDPSVGSPDRVRVALPEIAEALRRGFPGMEIVCAPTPELLPIFAALNSDLCDEDRSGSSYLAEGVAAGQVAAWFRACAGLFRAAPWKLFPSDGHLASVSIESLGVRDHILSVIGQSRESQGLILFPELRDYDGFLEMGEALATGEPFDPPSHRVLSFEAKSGLNPSLRAEIASHGWEMAGSRACPRMFVVDREQGMRELTAADFAIGEALALAVTGFLEERKALRSAWSGGEPFVRTRVVATSAGDVTVSIRIPFSRVRADYSPPFDVFGALRDIGHHADEIPEEDRVALEDELMRRFAESPEAEALEVIQASDFLFSYAAREFGVTVATMGPSALEEIVFDSFPRHLSVSATEAPSIVSELRALYAFLKRECGFAQADACLRVFDGDAVARLAAGLADKRRFGIAKSVVMAGYEAGHDVASPEGLDAWLRSTAGQAALDRLPSVIDARRSPQEVKTNRTKKSARKLARKSRKKNR